MWYNLVILLKNVIIENIIYESFSICKIVYDLD